ncbi:hypothetical protein T4D_739, partial [Trichinella pseudospiralis]
LLNAVKARTEWLHLLTLKQLKELMHTGKFYELASRLKVLAEVGVLSILRISCSEPNVQEGN